MIKLLKMFNKKKYKRRVEKNEESIIKKNKWKERGRQKILK